MKKYICIGGFIRSKNDGDEHYINPRRLAELYNINPEECYFARNDNDPLLLALRIEKLIQLRPRYDGAYLTPNLKNVRRNDGDKGSISKGILFGTE